MVDANQRWDVQQAIDWMTSLVKYNLTWIEEPTSPDDILGHAAISKVTVVTSFRQMCEFVVNYSASTANCH